MSLPGPAGPPGMDGVHAFEPVNRSFIGSNDLIEANQRHLVVASLIESQLALASAAEAMQLVESEIDHLWLASMTGEDRLFSERLAQVSHALQHAARLLNHHRTSG